MLTVSNYFLVRFQPDDTKVLRNLRGLTKVDFCSDPELNVCHKNARCELNSSAPRGYSCLCLESEGWTGDGIFTCSDFGECKNAYCTPVPGRIPEVAVLIMMIRITTLPRTPTFATKLFIPKRSTQCMVP
jgi:hypothetical protein